MISKITPSFGPVKSKVDEVLEITGTNFKCPDDSCIDLYCRFGDPPKAILVKATWQSNTRITCLIPKYAQPDVLNVEITLNGEDFTTNKLQYGYYDPYILNIYPRLINPNGTTEITMFGYGFVDSTVYKYLKVKYDNSEKAISCGGGKCTLYGQYISKNEIRV